GRRPLVFPAWENRPGGDGLLDEAAGQRLRLIRQLDRGDLPPFLVTTFQALMQPVPARSELTQNLRRLRQGDNVPLDELIAWLIANRFQRMEAVEVPGEFSQRGGIVDVFPLDAEVPFRLEFFGDEIESIRQFSPQTQRSLQETSVVELLVGQAEPADGALPSGHLCDFLPQEAWAVLVEPSELAEQGKHYLERTEDVRGLFSTQGVLQQLFRLPGVQLSTLPESTESQAFHLRVESVERFSGEITKLKEEILAAAAGGRGGV